MMSKKSIHNRKVRTLKAQEQPPNRWLTTMDTRPMNRSVRAPGKLAENEPSLPEKSKPTGGTHGSRPDQKQQPARKEFRGMPSGTGSSPKFLLIQHRDGKESQDEYDDFYADIRKHYQPVGWLEELWVEKIAVWSWRLRRLIRCESGQIARALAGHSYELQQSKADDLAEPESAPSSNPEMDAMTDHLFLPEKEDSTSCCDMKQ